MSSAETLTKPADYFCSVSSQDVGESLIGTAPHAKIWFLLEYAGKWGRKAFAESNIPDTVKSHFNQHLDKNPLTRLLLIKQDARSQRSGISFFVAISTHPQPTLLKFNLDSYDDLLNMDLASLSIRNPKNNDRITTDPLYLICSNGLRDQCCAKYGLPIHDALLDRLGRSLWQSSHHGGHRFAPNLLCLPHGLSYGRLTSDNAAEISSDYQAGRISLLNLRGRCAYPQPAQAAEAFLRANIQDDSLSNLTLTNTDQLSEYEWQVTLTSLDSAATHQVKVSKHFIESRIFASCIGDKQVNISEFQLLEHTIS